MKITTKIVKKVYQLAHLSENPTDLEIEKTSNNLQKIIDLVDELNEVDTNSVDVFASARTNKIADLRLDIADSDNPKYIAKAEKIRVNFPNRQGNFLVLDKRIIQDS
jgi:aspartyl/glutamyl-tRNA(Asn/Gln) amidotransferase C subunit